MEVIGNPYEILKNHFSGIPQYSLRIHWESSGIHLATFWKSEGILRNDQICIRNSLEIFLGIHEESLGNPKRILRKS